MVQEPAFPAYWDSTGKARYRLKSIYSTSRKCDKACEDLGEGGGQSSPIKALNYWYAVWADAGIADFWTLAHAIAVPSFKSNTYVTLANYVDSTKNLPHKDQTTDRHPSLPLWNRTGTRIFDILYFF